MNHWIFKSEPSCYSIDDLQRDGIEMWDGVRNYQVRNMMRDLMRVGDRVLFYHSNAGVGTGVVGQMEIVREAYPDPTQFDPNSEHPDPKSDPENPRWLCVDVRLVEKFPRTLTLQQIKSDPAFASIQLVKKGNRLSILPITKAQYQRMKKLVHRGRS